MTHREFAGTDEVFKKACELAKVQPTVRQASKFRSKRGSAYALLEAKTTGDKKCQ